MRKTKAETLDMLGEAQIPSDLLTPTEGSNWGLDGFPDMEYGAGTLEGFFPGDTSSLPGSDTAASDIQFLDEEVLHVTNTPDAAWFAADADDTPGLDLTDTAVLKEGGLANLDWLELHEQDEDRLPQNPVDLGIPELEEAWGVERRAGSTLHANNLDLDEVRYRAAAVSSTRPKYKFTAADLTRVVQRAMRRSAAGHPLPEIFREAAETLGDEAHRVRRAMAILKDEHGLAGRVFIRASAYPGYEQGRWTEQLRKFSSARYIIVEPRTLNGSVTVQGGRCTVTKKHAVSSVPWAEALRYYRPALERIGRKVATGDPRAALKAAFTTPAKVARTETVFPTHKTPSERISADEARKQFAAMSAPVRETIDPKIAREKANREKASSRILSWVRSGMLAASEAKAILGSNESGQNMLRQAASRIIRTKGASAFSGMINDTRPQTASEAEARAALASIQPPTPINKVAAAVVQYAKRAMSEGRAGRLLDELMRTRFADAAREAAKNDLQAVRQAHEGGAGFIYVDASAYASPSGVTGCEKGALKHRANQLKYVLAMDRCSSCALAGVKADGSRVCRQYNKALVTAADFPAEMAEIRKRNIRSTNMSDQEVTASYFSAAYDPNEFDLRHSMEDIEIEASHEPEQMGDILFGGLEF